MPRAKSTSNSGDSVSLVHSNGATVNVSADKAAKLVAGGLFSEAKAAAKATPAKNDGQ